MHDAELALEAGRERSVDIKSSLMMAATLGRLALLPELVDSVQEGAGVRTALMVGAVVAADILDGVVARKLEVDTNARRIADAAVDRASIITAFGAAISSDPSILAWYAPLAVRGGVIATGSNLCFWLRSKLVLGGNFHKLASLSQATFGIALVNDAPPNVMLPVAAATYGINAVSGADYLGAHIQYLKQNRSEKLERTRIRKLSGLRSLFHKKAGPSV